MAANDLKIKGSGDPQYSSKDYSSRLISYSWSIITVIKNYEQIFANANVVRFYNAGSSTYMIDMQRPILPGMEIVYEGWPGEIDIHNYELTSNATSSNGLINNLVIQFKRYQKFEGQP